MKKKFGVKLTRDQMKKVNGGGGDNCSTLQCYSGPPDGYFCQSANGPYGLRCYCFNSGVNTNLLCPPNNP